MGILRQLAGLLAVWALALGAPVPVPGASALAAPADTSITVRTPPDEALASYRSDPDYTYTRVRTDGPSWWSSVLEWLIGRQVEGAGHPAVGWILRLLVVGTVVALLGFGVYWLTQTRYTSAFDRPDRADGASPLGVTRRAIESDDFATPAREAAAAGRYREALRYRYLDLLQTLVRSGRVHWAPERTNHALLQDTAGTPVHGPFQAATRLFDRARYGAASIGPDDDAAMQRAVEEGREKAEN